VRAISARDVDLSSISAGLTSSRSSGASGAPGMVVTPSSVVVNGTGHHDQDRAPTDGTRRQPNDHRPAPGPQGCLRLGSDVLTRLTTGSDGQPGVGMGCLGSILGVIILVAVVVAVATVGLIVLAVVAVIVAVGLVAFAVDRLLVALCPKRRGRRDDLMGSWGMGSEVIDATATFEEDRPKPSTGEGDV